MKLEKDKKVAAAIGGISYLLLMAIVSATFKEFAIAVLAAIFILAIMYTFMSSIFK